MTFKAILHKLTSQKNISPTELSKETGISKSVLHRFFNDDTVNPTLDTLNKLAQFFDVSIDQLIGAVDINKRDISIPVIQWNDAIIWPNKAVTPIQYISVTVKSKNYFSQNTFGLIMNDSSMEPMFIPNTFLIFDPILAIKDRSFILYCNKKWAEPCFKQLIKHGEKKLVKSLNSDILNRIEELNDDATIIGVLVSAINNNLY